MLKVGDTAPDFALEDFDGPQTTLSELLDGESLVVYFYPADFSPVCTREACALRDRHDALREVGVRVLGVSPQGRDSHRRFRESYQLPFALLSDPSRKVIGTKFENRSSKQIQNSNVKNSKRTSRSPFGHSNFVLRICFGFRNSDFGFCDRFA